MVNFVNYHAFALDLLGPKALYKVKKYCKDNKYF